MCHFNWISLIKAINYRKWRHLFLADKGLTSFIFRPTRDGIDITGSDIIQDRDFYREIYDFICDTISGRDIAFPFVSPFAEISLHKA